MNLPEHLGGHQNETHVDAGAIDYLIRRFQPKSFLDVGCGPGGMVELAAERGLDAVGIDGDFTIQREHPERYIVHDYAKGEYTPDKVFDIGWSVEFLEHVEEEYVENYLYTFGQCKIIVVTHALPGQGGHHHVNEQPPYYWFDVFSRGFTLDVKATREIREASTMGMWYMRGTGMVFRNRWL